MTTKFIVLVADRDDPKHGEIVVGDTTAEAERLVETLLEAGFCRERPAERSCSSLAARSCSGVKKRLSSLSIVARTRFMMARAAGPASC